MVTLTEPTESDQAEASLYFASVQVDERRNVDRRKNAEAVVVRLSKLQQAMCANCPNENLAEENGYCWECAEIFLENARNDEMAKETEMQVDLTPSEPSEIF